MMRLVFAKSHVKGHYRTDPTTHEQVYVKPHEDGRNQSHQFDEAAFDRREKAILAAVKDSKASGVKHLDQLPFGVEAMRGVRIRSLRNGSTGVVTSVNNLGETNIQWSDKQSADKNGGSPETVMVGTKSNPRMVTEYHSHLGKSDLAEFVVESGKEVVKQGHVVKTTTAISIPQSARSIFETEGIGSITEEDYPDDPKLVEGMRLLSESWSKNKLIVQPSQAGTIAHAVTYLSNLYDYHAEDKSSDTAMRRMDRASSNGLATLASALMRIEDAETKASPVIIVQHEPEPPQGQMNLFKAIRQGALWWFKRFTKSHVKQYTRSDGTIVREHDDKRLKKPGEAKNPRAAAKEKPKKGPRQAKPEETPQPHVTDHPEYPTVEPAKEGELAAWLNRIMEEPDIQAAMEEVRSTTPTDKIYKNAETGEYTPERAKIHEAIVASMMNPKAVPEAGQKPHAMIFMGRPASGKTSALQPAAKELGVEFTVINADDVKEKLPEYNGRNAGVVHEESSDIAERQLFRKALESGHHIMLDVTGGNVKKLQKWVEDFHGLGYEISIMMAELPVEECCARAVNRFRHTGRFVPPNYIANDVDHKPEKTYDVLKDDPRVSHWRRYSTDVKKGEQAPLRERGSKEVSGNPFNKGGSFEYGGSLLGRSHGEDVQRNGREPKRPDLRHPDGFHQVQKQHASVASPVLDRACKLRETLTKSIQHYSIDLTSPEIAPDVRGTLLAARHRQQIRLEQLNDMIAKVQA